MTGHHEGGSVATAPHVREAAGGLDGLLGHPAGWAGEARVAFGWPDAVEKATVTAFPRLEAPWWLA